MASSTGFQAKGIPKLKYNGPKVITNGTPYQIMVTSDKLFYGQPGCTESISLFNPHQHSASSLPRTLYTIGEKTGTFSPSGGDGSAWLFNVTFRLLHFPTEQQLIAAVESGSRNIRLPVQLDFSYRCSETVPKAVLNAHEDLVVDYPQTLTVQVDLEHILTDSDRQFVQQR